MLTSDLRCALRVSPNCLLGLIAKITTPAKIAIAATTSKISSSVKPRLDLFIIENLLRPYFIGNIIS